jgi:HEAT repeat protein
MKTLAATVLILLASSAAFAQIDRVETDFVVKRFKEPKHESLMSGASWALAHQYGDIDRVKEVFEFSSAYFEAFGKYEEGDDGPLVALGGVKGFKAKLSGMLKDPDRAVRTYAMTLIGITGDRAMAPQVAAFLKDPSAESDYDERRRAMVALGLMGAVEYKLKIAPFLRSKDHNDRSGATRALAAFGAKEYAGEIAALMVARKGSLEDVFPIHFLVETDTARHYKPQLVEVMLREFDRERSEAAMYALVSIDAKEQAANIARLLNDEFRKGNAAKALALLGATQYTRQIALLLKDQSSLVRCAAALAIGILDAKTHSRDVANLLKDPEEFVRPYAAAAIMLLRAEEHYKDALPHLENRNSLGLYLIGRSFSPIVQKKVDAVTERALNALDAAEAEAKDPVSQKK